MLRFLFWAAWATSGFAATLVDDQFADANSRNQDLAANSLRLFQGRAGTVRTDTPGQVRFDITNAGGSEAWWAFFRTPGEAVRLGPGDQLTVSVTFTLDGFPANGQDIRFGIFDSLGTRNTTDLTGGMNQATFVDDPGYGVQFAASGTGSAFIVGRRANLSGGNIFNSFGDFTTLNGSMASPARQRLAEGTPYTLHFRIERLTTTESRISVSVEGGALEALSHTVVDSSSALPDAFDYFAFRVTGPAFAQRIAFSRMRVDYQPAPPVITSQPQPSQLTVQAGANVAMRVGAMGADLRYQWNRDGRAVSHPTATLPTLELNAVTLEAAGSYTATVSNDGGSVTSSPVVLRVSRDPVPPPPAITTQPQPVTVTVGSPAQLSVTATGSGLTYQWFRNENAIAGATSAALRLAAAQFADAGDYRVRIANGSGTLASATARLTVVSALSVVETFPANGASGLCLDPPLSISFSAPPRLGTSGRIRLLRSDGAVADTIDLGAATHQRLIGSANTPFRYLPVIIEGATARLFFPRGRLTPGEAYSIEVEQGAFTDAAGGPLRAREAARWNFSVRTAGPAPNATALTVDADGDGDFCTVQSAIDHVPALNIRRTVITVKPGDYLEQVYVPSGKNFLTVRGNNRNTVIRYPNHANLNAAQRQVFGVDANDFTLEYVTVRNTTPRGGSQAEAFRGNGQRLFLNYVNLISFQDTLWLQGQAFVNSAYIEGDVDFMWGGGAVFFQDSELRSVSSNGYLTQIRNGRDQVGHVYLRCRLTAPPGITGTYLSRIDPNVFPFSQVVFVDSTMGPHIRPEGWLLNNAVVAPTVQFLEFGSRDESGELLDTRGRAAFSRQLTAAEAERWRNPATLLSGWSPDPRRAAAIELADLERNFDGTPQAVSARTDPPGLPVTVTYAGRPTPPTEVGLYPVTAVVDDAEYQGALSANLVIRQTPVAITLGDLQQAFDGSPKPVRVTTNPPATGVQVTYNGSATVPSAVGRYSVVASLASPNLRGRASATLTIREAGPEPLRAFPEAEGEGAQSRGGRGGDVYRVTNLNDAGPGSLRAGIASASGPRTILFEVGGTIQLQSRLNINRSFLTLAGQTAPGDGITIAGWPTVISGASHVIVRYLRFRMGDANCPATQDDALWVDRSSHVILDHVSASWSVDETLSVTDSTQVTVQWSFIAESLRNSCHVKGAHGYGSLIRFGDGQVSFHHNLFAHHDSRNPRLGDGIGLDFVNNVVYNWGSTAGYSGANDEGSPRLNLVGSLFLPGPSTQSRTRVFSGGGVNTGIYQENNLLNGADPDWLALGGTYTRREETRFDLAQVTTTTAALALEQVLATGGASLRRDAVDERLAGEVRGRRGRIIDSPRDVGGFPALRSGPVPLDTDGDGLPDDWETARGLNPRDPQDGARSSAGSGYTHLEVYLNSLTTRRAE